MRNQMFLMLAAAAVGVVAPLPAAAQEKDKKAEEPASREIVVTGRSLKETAQALADCIARGCPPDEEIRAALAHGENQFVSGDYRGAKATLGRTADRTRRFSKTYPIEVSDLFRASGRVAEHLGEGKAYQLAVLDMRDALKSGVAKSDPRLMIAQIEVGDSRARLGYPLEAFRIYKDVVEEATKAGHARVALYAALRHGMTKYSWAKQAKLEPETADALAIIDKVVTDPTDKAPDVKLIADVFLARLDREAGKMDRTLAILKRFTETNGTARPILISAQPIRTVDTIPNADNKDMAILGDQGGQFVDRWMDIGFWVNANGNVSDIEILRSSGSTRGWARPVIDSIKSRLYAPLKPTAADSNPAFYMVERYTYTSRYIEGQDQTGTRLRTRSDKPRIERIDLTPDNYEALPVEKPSAPAAPASSPTS